MRPAVAWDETPEVGGWIAERLAPFGPTVGHAVPLGYEAYVVVAVERFGELIGALGRFTGDQPVHCGMWDGFGWWRTPGARSEIGLYWEEGYEPTPEDIESALARGRAWAAAREIPRPAVELLRLPHRDYYLWTGPLDTAPPRTASSRARTDRRRRFARSAGETSVSMRRQRTSP